MITAKRLRAWVAVLPAIALALVSVVPSAAAAQSTGRGHGQVLAGRSTIYGGGPFYRGGQPVIDTLRSSGFTTVVLWTIHVRAGSGDLWFNDDRVVAGGKYVGDPAWPARLKTLKQAPTSVDRVEVGVGSAGPDDWGVIAQLIRAQGTGPTSILYRNFAALKQVTGADAINDDDEASYDLATTTQFAKMTGSLGYKFAIVPYTNSGFWASLKGNLGSMLDRVYLQAYAGGSGNDPGRWSRDLGVPADPGLWSKHGSGCSAGDSPSTVESRMRSWRRSAGISGGFMWLFDDMLKCGAQGSPAAYARAINRAVA